MLRSEPVVYGHHSALCLIGKMQTKWMMGIEVADGPAATMKIDNQWPFSRPVVHASSQTVFVKRQLQNTGFNLWKRRAFPCQSIHAAVIPAKAQRLEFIEKCCHKSLLSVDIPCVRIRLVFIAAVVSEPTTDITAMP